MNFNERVLDLQYNIIESKVLGLISEAEADYLMESLKDTVKKAATTLGKSPVGTGVNAMFDVPAEVATQAIMLPKRLTKTTETEEKFKKEFNRIKATIKTGEMAAFEIFSGPLIPSALLIGIASVHMTLVSNKEVDKIVVKKYEDIINGLKGKVDSFMTVFKSKKKIDKKALDSIEARGLNLAKQIDNMKERVLNIKPGPKVKSAKKRIVMNESTTETLDNFFMENGSMKDNSIELLIGFMEHADYDDPAVPLIVEHYLNLL